MKLNPRFTIQRTIVAFPIFAFLSFVNIQGFCQELWKFPPDTQKRIGQVPAVVENLQESQDKVLALLVDPDAIIQYTTLQELTKQPYLPHRVRDSVRRLIASEDSRTRMLAIACLGHTLITDQAEADAITSALNDPVATVRLEAIQASAMVDMSEKCRMGTLLAKLQDPDTSVQLGTVKVLGKIKCHQLDAVPALLTLSDKSTVAALRVASVEALGNLDANIDQAKEILMRLALKDHDSGVRHGAVLALQSLRSMTVEQVSSLLPLTKDVSSQVRQAAAYTYVVLGRNQPRATEMLGILQNDHDEGVRYAAAAALRYGQTEEPYFSLIARSLNDTSIEVRFGAATSLVKLLKEDDRPAEEDSGADRIFVNQTVWPKDLVNASAAALTQSDSALLREYIADAIRRFNVSDEVLTKQLSDLAKADTDAWSRRASIRAISNMKTTPDALGVLIAATRDTYDVVREQAVISLGKLSLDLWPLSEPEKAAKEIDNLAIALAASLEDKAPTVERAALHAVETLGSGNYDKIQSTLLKTPTIKSRIIKALTDQDPDIRLAAAKALGSLPLAETDIQPLVTALRDENLQVGIQAAISIRNIDFSPGLVEQSVGLRPITFWDFTTPEAVIKKTTSHLENVAQKCHVLDVLMTSLKTLLNTKIYLEQLQSLRDIGQSASAMVKALQDGEFPSNDAFVKAANAAINDCAPSLENMAKFATQELNSPDPDVRVLAASTVGDLQLQNDEIDSAIARLLEDGSRQVRKAAVVALPEIVQKEDVNDVRAAANRLVTAAGDSDYDVRQAAIDSMIKLGALDSLGRSFQSPDPDVRKAIIEGYETLKTPALVIEDVLRSGLKDKNRFVRLATLSYLSSRGNEASRLLRDVVPLLSDTSAENRAAAAVIFGYYRRDAAFAVAQLQQLLKDEDPLVKSTAADSLGWIGPSARGSIPALFLLLTDDVVGPHAKLALQRMGDVAIDPLTNLIARSADRNQAREASTVLDTLRGNKDQSPFRLTLKDGAEETVQLQSTVIVAVATWCPFSRKLRDLLARDDVKGYFAGIKIYFIFEDETNAVIAHLQEQLKEHKDWPEKRKEEFLNEVRERLKPTGFYDDSFLGALPGAKLQVLALSKLSVGAFPSVLSLSGSVTSAEQLTASSWLDVDDWVNSDWFSHHVNMPKDLRAEIQSISASPFKL